MSGTTSTLLLCLLHQHPLIARFKTCPLIALENKPKNLPILCFFVSPILFPLICFLPLLIKIPREHLPSHAWWSVQDTLPWQKKTVIPAHKNTIHTVFASRPWPLTSSPIIPLWFDPLQTGLLALTDKSSGLFTNINNRGLWVCVHRPVFLLPEWIKWE